MLRRLHRLQIQATLQRESSETEIVYPQVDKHKVKDGESAYVKHITLQEISDTKINEAVL